MKLLCGLAAILLASAVSAVAVDLTPDNVDDFIGGSAPALVEFYAPWCGHCKALKPEWEIVEKAFKAESKVVIAKCDADAHRSVASPHGVTGFPTIMYFEAGSTSGEKYSGGRTAKDIVAWINNEAGVNGFIREEPSEVVTITEANFDTFVGGDADVLVEFYAPWCGHCKSLAPVYEKVALAFLGEKDLVIAKCDATQASTLASKYGVTGYPTLKWFARGGQEASDYSVGRGESDFIAWINDKTGKQRTVGGGFTSQAGRDQELDELAAEFMTSGDRASVQATTEDKASKIPTGKFYVIAMKRIQDKGEGYLATEKARLQRMIAKGAASVDKVNLFKQRINILSVFEDAANGDDDEDKDEL